MPRGFRHFPSFTVRSSAASKCPLDRSRGQHDPGEVDWSQAESEELGRKAEMNNVSRKEKEVSSKPEGGRAISRRLLLLCLLALAAPRPATAEIFNVKSGDVVGLIAAIKAANSNGQGNVDPGNVINLEPSGRYLLTAPDNDTDGPNGLPTITSILTIGNGIPARTALATIQRSKGAPPFRILHVSATGRLRLINVIVNAGNAAMGDGSGGGLFNLGQTVLTNTVFSQNAASATGGAIFNGKSGEVTLRNSLIVG